MRKESKFIFVSDGYKGGATNFLYQHMNYLKSKKKDVILIDDSPAKTYEKLNINIKKYKVKVSTSNYNTKNQIENIIMKNFGNNYIFITNYVFLIKYFFLFKKLKKNNNKIIITLHSGLLNLNIKNYLGGLIFSFIYPLADKIYFGSESAKKWWKIKYPWMKIKKAQIIYNGIEINPKKKKNKIKKFLKVSFVGRLEEENDPEFFLDIANKYLHTNSKCVFNIFGSGSLTKSLIKKNSKKKVNFLGWRKAGYIYKNTDILIITSKVNNFPYVALEAKSHGIPVITCSKGDIKKIIKNKHDGLINYSRSSDIMVKLIDKIVKKYSYYSKNSIINSKKFDVNVSYNKFWGKIL